jgi:hypothetical protein
MASADGCLNVLTWASVNGSRLLADGVGTARRRTGLQRRAGSRRRNAVATGERDDDFVRTEPLEVGRTEVGSDFATKDSGVDGGRLEDDAASGVGEHAVTKTGRQLAEVLMSQGESHPEAARLSEDVGDVSR